MSELTKEEFEKKFERLRDATGKSLKELFPRHPFTIDPTLEKKWTRVKKWKKNET
jgi:hypothetical protein